MLKASLSTMATKSRVCLNRTINLAKPKCADKSSTTTLVFKPDSPKPSSVFIKPPISNACPKQIRICTGAELKKMCYRPPCVCPPQKKGTTLIDVLVFGLKSLLAGSLVYWTWEAGLWGDAEDTQMLYTRFCHLMMDEYSKAEYKMNRVCELERNMRTQLPELVDKCSQPPFKSSTTMYKIQEMWNHTVTALFEAVGGFPSNLIDFLKDKAAGEECTPVKRKN